MTKAFLRKSLIAFSGTLLLGYGAVLACGYSEDDDWEYYSVNTNFTPEASANSTYAPLFLSGALFNRSDYELPGPGTFNAQIGDDWKNYLKNVVDEESVDYFLLGESLSDVNGISEFYNSKKPNAVSEKWIRKIKLTDKKARGFFQFLSIAKYVEKASFDEDWTYDTIGKRTIKDRPWLDKLENTYKSTQDLFLRNRYWFQAIKADFYSDNQQTALDFFFATEKSQPRNTLYYRALSYVAGVYARQQKYAVSNYFYSRVFQQCPELRLSAVLCFHPRDESDWNQTLAMAKNEEERMSIWALRGYYGDELIAIDTIYSIKPKSEYLDFLLSRLVNREEIQSDLSLKNGFGMYYDTVEVERPVRISAVKLIGQIADSRKTANPFMWNIAAGYMQTLVGNYKSADQYFDKGEKEMPKTELAKNQMRLFRFVNKLRATEKMDRQTENAFLPDLKWLYEELPAQHGNNARKDEWSYGDGPFRCANAADWSKQYISKLYKAQNNRVMAEVFNRDRSYYQNSQNLLDMKALFLKTNKTPFEQLALKIYNVSLDDINYYQALTATYNDKIDEAVGFMQQSNKSHDTLLANPFTGNIQDCHDCDFARPQKRKYTDLDFLKTIQLMQAKIAKSEAVYTNSMLIANGFYNITYYGNARSFYYSNIFGFDDPATQKQALDCSLAKQYYQRALAAAANDEQRAKSVYMIAKCERNDYINQQLAANDRYWEFADDKGHWWDSFHILKTKYSKTKYYREVMAECGYFRSYVNGR